MLFTKQIAAERNGKTQKHCRRLIRALQEQQSTPAAAAEEKTLVNRRDIAKFLKISLVTLNDWVNRGLPSHKQRGRVYFDKQEVKEYIKNHRRRIPGFSRLEA